MGVALCLSAGCEVRGGHFFACYKCIDCAGSKLKVVVSNCVFEACMVGILSSGAVTVRHCTAHNVYCFLFCMGPAKFKFNSVLNSNKFYESGVTEMVTCHGGVVLPLATVHICSSDSAAYPVFEGNVLTRCKLYVGERPGVFAPMSSTLSYSSVIAEKRSFQTLNLHCTFHQSTTVWKLLRSSEPSGPCEAKKCVCSGSHSWPMLEQLDYTTRALPNPYDSSCDSKLFDSDEDDN